jgi:DNA-binding HxlR family transcriptional regulator
MATALDVIGGRWTPLILRELLGGPARFQDLQDGLPGIAKNLLADRLRQLEADEIVRRVSVSSTTLYGLTEQGGAIRPVLEALGFWGAGLRRVGPAVHDRSIRAIAMALQAILARAGDALPVERHVVELEIEGEHVEIVLGPRPTATARPCTDADARVRVPTSTISDVLLGQRLDRKRFVHLAGNKAARAALLNALGTMVRPAARASS